MGNFCKLLIPHSIYAYRILNRNHAPVCSGVYFITTFLEGIESPYYIGSAHSLIARIIQQKDISFLKKNKIKHRVYIIPTHCDKYKELERELIIVFQPIKNVHYKSHCLN